MNIFKLVNTKILLSSTTILAAGALIAGATFAFFSDSEVSAGNSFTGGAVAIEISNPAHSYQGAPGNGPLTFTPDGFSFGLEDLKPLDWGEVTYSLLNEENNAHVCAMVESTGNAENERNSSEIEAGDLNGGDPGPGEGELQDFMSFAFGGESGLLSDIAGKWFEVGTINNGDSGDFGIGYCFGEYNGTTCVPNSDGDVNVAQTDSMLADISFYAVQARNNEQFDCSTLNGTSITDDDLETVSKEDAATNDKWFFYNDSNDTIMSIDQFDADGGENHMDTVAGIGAAKMVLHDATARYNIATYRYNDVELADITDLKYRIYDGSASSQTPYLHFNVSFDGNDTWQRRLVMVPTGVTPETWVTVDAIDGGNAMWTYSGPTWPAGLVDETGTTPGTTPRSWNDILANYPNTKTRTTDSFLGVRVGHPGPDGEVGYVDWISFNGEVSNFNN